jgi:hypothetical protein
MQKLLRLSFDTVCATHFGAEIRVVQLQYRANGRESSWPWFFCWRRRGGRLWAHCGYRQRLLGSCRCGPRLERLGWRRLVGAHIRARTFAFAHKTGW